MAFLLSSILLFASLSHLLGSDRSELQSVLQDKYSKKFQMLTAAELEAVYAGWLGDHVQVYTSARAGVGKSHTITRRITQVRNFPILKATSLRVRRN